MGKVQKFTKEMFDETQLVLIEGILTDVVRDDYRVIKFSENAGSSYFLVNEQIFIVKGSLSYPDYKGQKIGVIHQIYVAPNSTYKGKSDGFKAIKPIKNLKTSSSIDKDDTVSSTRSYNGM